MEQCLFDELILLLLETISSKDYLESLGINREKVSNWNRFKKRIREKKVKRGIYARPAGRGAVHYYGVDSNGMVANGYPNKGGLDPKYAIGLDAQPDHSHGLCQTFALMFIMGEKDRLKKGNGYMDIYFQNVITGLCFLREFINSDYNERERCWDLNGILENMSKLCKNDVERREILKSLQNKDKLICLTDIIDTILHQAYRKNLKQWFYND